MNRQNHYIQRDILIDSSGYKKHFFLRDSIDCNFHFQSQKGYKEAEQQKIFRGDSAIFFNI